MEEEQLFDRERQVEARVKDATKIILNQTKKGSKLAEFSHSLFNFDGKELHLPFTQSPNGRLLGTGEIRGGERTSLEGNEANKE